MSSPPIAQPEGGDDGGEGPSGLKNPAPAGDDSDGESSGSSTESMKFQQLVEEFDAGDSDGEGFKTPDQKISVKDCPPAPMRPRPSPPIGKRKARRGGIFCPEASTSQAFPQPQAQVRKEEDEDDEDDDDASSRKRARGDDSGKN